MLVISCNFKWVRVFLSLATIILFMGAQNVNYTCQLFLRCRREIFIHKIRDREEGIVIYSFYTWFSFVTWVWVNIFLEIVSSKTTTTHIFNQAWEIGPQAWDRSFQPAGVRVGRYNVNPFPICPKQTIKPPLSDHSVASLVTCVWAFPWV